ncbi:glutamine synthetase family protein [Brevibacterium album]|uniref:glutamine synthetase family protein n=1 Tax=Brevibacterium album TaxID=417948 RepID=UPI00048D4829|nr:glutamine synthetase family protein [Brevibacterium album]
MALPALTFIATSDLVGHARGRSVPSSGATQALRRGVGWVPANLAINTFGEIADDNVFGAAGDLRLVPDATTGIDIPAGHGRPDLRLLLADQRLPDGSEWDCCPRTFARRALRGFTEATGLEVVASFEHEFAILDAPAAGPFSLRRLRGAEPFGTELVELLDSTGLQPENWLPEYSPQQYEITLEPAPGLIAADRAVLLRELVHDLAARHERTVTFAPIAAPGAGGSGVHVHLSLHDARTGAPALYDADAPSCLSEIGARFSAGIIRHAGALTALSACSPSSYQRLAPHSWSVGGAFLGERNREALLRICPTSTLGGGDPTRQLNLEFRAADATANPWIVLGALVRAGLEGLRRGYEPEHIWPEEATEAELAGVPRIPGSVDEALAALTEDEVAAGWFHPDLLRTYLDVKRSESEAVRGLTPEEICRKVADVY